MNFETLGLKLRFQPPQFLAVLQSLLARRLLACGNLCRLAFLIHRLNAITRWIAENYCERGLDVIPISDSSLIALPGPSQVNSYALVFDWKRAAFVYPQLHSLADSLQTFRLWLQ